MRKKLLTIFACAFCLQACANSRSRIESPDASIEAPVIQDKPVEVAPITPPGSEVYGPPVPSDQAVTSIPTGSPAPTIAIPTPAAPKLCVALGPGMAKALAEATVLEALVKAGLPIRCVVGSEMGAVVGALFAKENGNTNTLAWELFKLNKSNYFNFPLLSLNEAKSSGAKLHEVLESIFRGGQIESLPIQFATLATDSTTGAVVPFSHGKISEALSATLAIPDIFEPWEISHHEYVSGAISSPLALDMAASLGANFIIVVNVMDDVGSPIPGSERFQRAFAPVRNLLRMQRRDVKELIQIHLPNINYDDFAKQAEIFAAGKAEAESEVARIKADWDAVNATVSPSPAATNTELP